MEIGSTIVIILFFVLVIAETAELFIDSDVFAGLMLFARPVIVFVLVLLDGQGFWAGLLYGVLWGFLGFVIQVCIEDMFSLKIKVGNRSFEQPPRDLPKATSERNPQTRTKKTGLAAQVGEKKETKTKKTLETLPSAPSAESSTLSIPKENRVVPDRTPPSKNT